MRIAILVPAQNAIIESEVYRMAPEGITIHFERLIPKSGLPDRSVPSIVNFLTELGEDSSRAASVVAMVNPKVIAFGCTSGSFFKGIEHDKEVIKTIEAASGIPAITTSTAVIQALEEVKLRRVCLISPYPDFFNEKAKEFLEANGFSVLVMKSLVSKPGETAVLPPEAAYDLAESAYTTECDGVFCSCTEFRTIEILDKFEKKFDKPMVSANQATLWLALRKAGFSKPIAGFGQLLSHT